MCQGPAWCLNLSSPQVFPESSLPHGPVCGHFLISPTYAIALECPSLCLAPQKGKRKIKKGKEHWPLKFCGSGFRQWGRVFQQYGGVITVTICLLAPLLSGAAVFRAWILLFCGMGSFCTLVLTSCVQAAPWVYEAHSAVATGLEKVSFLFNPKEKTRPKNVQTIRQLHWFHKLAK